MSIHRKKKNKQTNGRTHQKEKERMKMVLNITLSDVERKRLKKRSFSQQLSQAAEVLAEKYVPNWRTPGSSLRQIQGRMQQVFWHLLHSTPQILNFFGHFNNCLQNGDGNPEFYKFDRKI